MSYIYIHHNSYITNIYLKAQLCMNNILLVIKSIKQMHFKNNKINETMVILIIKVKLFPISKKLYKMCKTLFPSNTSSIEFICCILSMNSMMVNLILTYLN